MAEQRTEATLPSYRLHNDTPDINVGPTGGIAIAAEPKVSDVFPIHGAFAVPKARAEDFEGHLLKAVVLLVRGPYPASCNVGAGELLFADDLVEDGDWIRGYFNVDLFKLFNLMTEPNLYRVSASIFENVSEVISVEVNG